MPRNQLTFGELKAKLNSLNVPDDTQVFIYLDEQGSPIRSLKIYETGEEMEEENYNKADWYDVAKDRQAIIIKGDSY